jgi:hypothetical protein
MQPTEKYLADFWIIEASDLDVALKPATEGWKACNRKVEALRRCQVMASTSRIVHHHRRTRKS